MRREPTGGGEPLSRICCAEDEMNTYAHEVLHLALRETLLELALLATGKAADAGVVR